VAGYDEEAHKTRYYLPVAFHAESASGQVLIPSSGMQEAGMAVSLLKGNRPRVSFQLVAVAYEEPAYPNSVALLQYTESGEARKSSAISFTARPYNLTSYEAEAGEYVLAPEHFA
jgi:hypothetical protein